MISVNRALEDEPTSLHKKFSTDDKTEFERAKAHIIDGTSEKSFEFSRYKSADVKRALDNLFHGKCAYCESFYAKTQPVDVEHYRPKGAVEGTEHTGYWWLAMDWENLLPSCIDCNRRRNQRTPKPDQQGSMVLLTSKGDFARGKSFNTGKQSAFPLATNSPRAEWDKTKKSEDVSGEQRLLLDPTRDPPENHLVFHVDRRDPDKLISIVYPKPLNDQNPLALPVLGNPAAVVMAANAAQISAIGAVSIQVYGLNRLSLVQARTKLLRDLEFLLEMSLSLQNLIDDLNDRMDARELRIATAQGTGKVLLEDDQRLDTKIRDQLTALSDKLLDQVNEMTESTSQFSALAIAWRDAFFDS